MEADDLKPMKCWLNNRVKKKLVKTLSAQNKIGRIFGDALC